MVLLGTTYPGENQVNQHGIKEQLGKLLGEQFLRSSCTQDTLRMDISSPQAVGHGQRVLGKRRCICALLPHPSLLTQHWSRPEQGEVSGLFV